MTRTQQKPLPLFTSQEILEQLNQFVKLRKRAHCHTHNDLHLRPKSATLDSCIGVLAIAMSMVCQRFPFLARAHDLFHVWSVRVV